MTDIARNRLFIALSPLALIGICATVQVVAGRFIGALAAVPTVLSFWLVIALLQHWHSGVAGAWTRFKRPVGAPIWSVLAVIAGLLSLQGFLDNWQLLADAPLVVAWLVFALVNPWFEESYFRGLLMDSTASWGRLASLLYSSAWFAATALIWGIHSEALRKPEAIGAIFVGGLVWGLAYQRTGSLRWCVVGHMLANLLGLAALVLLNVFDPTVG